MKHQLLKPKSLKPGDTIGIISNSAPLAGLVPHRFQKGIGALEGMGYKIKIAPHTLVISGYVSASGKERASDLNALFADQSVRAIISCIGGNHSNQMIPYIDYEQVINNPKILCGYSDTTVLLEAIYTMTGLVGFYGPSLLNQFGENPEIIPYTKEYFLKAVGSLEPIGSVLPSAQWTEEFLDWFEKKDTKRPRKMLANPGWEWLREGSCAGPLIGGCLTSLLRLAGTRYWPDLNESILFWEIPEGEADMTRGSGLATIDAHLADLGNIGALSSISGMIVGRPYGYSRSDITKLKKLILNQLTERNIPVLFGVDIGHTDPMITVPIGLRSSLDSKNNLFSIDEAATIN